MDEELGRLVAEAVRWRFDPRGWLVIADRLSDGGNPLGDYIVRRLQGGEASSRLEAMRAEWQERFVPWGRFVRWTPREGLVIEADDAELFVEHAVELRELALPIRPRRGADACGFDAGHQRLAWVHPHRDTGRARYDVTIWRVADDTVIERRGETGDLLHDHFLEFRGGGIYAVSDSGMYPEVSVYQGR